MVSRRPEGLTRLQSFLAAGQRAALGAPAACRGGVDGKLHPRGAEQPDRRSAWRSPQRGLDARATASDGGKEQAADFVAAANIIGCILEKFI